MLSTLSSSFFLRSSSVTSSAYFRFALYFLCSVEQLSLVFNFRTAFLSALLCFPRLKSCSVSIESVMSTSVSSCGSKM